MPVSYFESQLATKPDEMAVSDLRQQRSWRELDQNVRSLAAYLSQEAGIKPGEHLALMVGNRVEYIEGILAALLAGLWVTPINTHLTPGEVDYICQDCGASVILYDRDHAHLLADNISATRLDIVQLVAGLPSLPAIEFEPDAAAGGNMLYTSGTTGKPKGVKRAKPATLGAMIERMTSTGRAFGLTGRGPHLVTGPLYHAAPGLFALYDLLNGASVLIMPRWDCDVFLDTVREYRVTTTHLVPTMFVRLLEIREHRPDPIDISSLSYVLHGAAPISQSVKQRMIDWWGPLLTEYWGATESGVVTLVDSRQWADHPGTVGRAISNFTVYVGDQQGNPTGEPEGLLFCRHRQLEQVFSYHNDPNKTRKAHPQPYVFSLGDIGRVDDDGFVYLSDRESHMIICGGVNIYPTEVEQALMEHEEVIDCAVFGIPNEEWGEEVKAVVQLRDGPNPDSEQQLRDFVRSQIAAFKVPRTIDFIDELPRNPSGKVLVRQLRQNYIETAAAKGP